MLKSKKRLISILLACFLCFTNAGCAQKYAKHDTTVFSSNIALSVEIYGNDCFDKMQAYADNLNDSINPNISTSYIARFNEMGVGEISVDKAVYDLVKSAQEYYEITDGAFDVTLSPLSTLWKVDSVNIHLPHNDQSLPTLETLTQYSSKMNAIGVEEKNGEYFLSKTDATATIDLGGIAKGYLTDALVAIAKENGVKSAIVNAGGNLSLLGKRIDGEQEKEWKVGVTNCFEYGYLCGIEVSDCAVVTSGAYERYYQTSDGVKICHLINPFTNMPVGVKWENGRYENIQDYVISCTVISPSAQQCDVLATAVCVLGKNAGLKMLEEQGVQALVVTADGKYATVGDLKFMQGEFPLNSMEKYE